jgi:hypothetical protein
MVLQEINSWSNSITMWIQKADIYLTHKDGDGVVGYCEHCNESSGSIKSGEFLG